MRRIVCSLIIAMVPLTAMAQQAPAADSTPAVAAPAAKPPRHTDAGGPITRDAYVKRAADAAGKRFDAIDVEHKGVLTRAQIRAWHQAHHRAAKPAAQ